jgi:hypothetical protein
MFGSVRSIAEGFAATREFASVGFFSGVRSQMGFQILQTRIGLVAAFKLKKCLGSLYLYELVMFVEKIILIDPV